MLDKEAWIREFKDKNILIWGYGMEGKSSYRFIRSLLPDQVITIADKKKDAITDTVNTILLDESETNFNEYDLILKAPGIVVSEDIDKTKITGQAPLFLKHYKKQTIGITGTKGKSTTSSLIASVLKTKYTTFLVGNIGKACFDIIEDLTEDALIVFEISCHQLEFSTYSPHVAVYINLFDEHLDHYGTLEKYGKAKDQIFKHQNEDDILIIGEAIKDRAERENKLIIGEDIYAVNHTVHAANKEIEIKDCALHGEHNYQNLAVAYEIANLYQVSDENFLEAVKEFVPLKHRLENIGTFNSVTYINDSISTIGETAIKALETYPETSVILIGGNDRGIVYDKLEETLYAKKDLQVIFMYATGKRIHQEMKEKGLVREGLYEVENLDEATALAKKIAKKDSVCLLSPAASSYDHFKNFEVRGDYFRKLVEEK